MQVRAKSSVKLTNGRVNLDYTFVPNTKLEKVVEELMVQLAFESGTAALLELANTVAEQVQCKA